MFSSQMFKRNAHQGLGTCYIKSLFFCWSYYTWVKGKHLRCLACDKFQKKEMSIICLIKKKPLGREVVDFLGTQTAGSKSSLDVALLDIIPHH